MAGEIATSRVSDGSTDLTTIDRRKVRIFFQTFPGTKAESGIAGLHFVLTVAGGPPTEGDTPADGHVDIFLAVGDTAALKILGSEYDVSLLDDLPFPITQLRGVQQRLNMLGYNAGTLHTDDLEAKKGFNQNQATERAIINFQADHEPLLIDGTAGEKTQPKIRSAVQSAGGE